MTPPHAPDTGPTEGNDPEIRAERAFLTHAKDALLAMHQEVLDTETQESSAEDRDEVWHNLMYRRARNGRAQALIDLPDVPLFFGRLDYEPGVLAQASQQGSVDGAHVSDRVYVGRRHVRDDEGRPLVIDWRAGLSGPFYRATRDDRHGVLLRRRYGFSESAELTAYEDEPLVGHQTGPDAGEILAAEIERPRSGPMRDIVATIQPEQDDLVRAPLFPTLCVQGAPGTGKTAVGLHRIAYLLYTEPERLGRGSGVTVLGPNRSFLSYIHRVLPALGEVDVSQTTLGELIERVPVRRVEEPFVARIKGDARMAEVLRRGLWGQPQPLTETLVVPRGVRRWRVLPDELAEAVTDLRAKGGSYGAGQRMLAQRIASLVMRKIEESGEAYSESALGELQRSKEVRAAARAMWPKADPIKLVLGLLTDADRLAAAADGLLTREEQAAIMLAGRPRGPKSAKWSSSDLALIDEAAALIERPRTLTHVVVDEAQDLSPMECRAIGRRCPTGSLTVLGDLAQGTSPWAIDHWSTLLEHLGQPDADVAVLDRGFRVPGQIIDYAARLLPHIAPGLDAPSAVRRDPGALTVTAVASKSTHETVAASCRDHLADAGTVAVIAADADVAALRDVLGDHDLAASLLGTDGDALEACRLVAVPASLAKGLEFDTVLVVEPARIVAAEPRGLHRLYVVLTRAVSALHVIHSEPLPEPLAHA